jgi:hypothetical protein
MEVAMRIAFCGLLIALSSVLLWQAVQIDGQAAVYPILVTGGAVLFSVVYTVRQAILANGWPAEVPYAVPPSTVPRVALFVAIWTIYVIALGYLGFMVATWLALVASSLAIGRFRALQPLWIALFVLIMTVLLKIVLYVPVPQGWLDIQLEIFLYSLR